MSLSETEAIAYQQNLAKRKQLKAKLTRFNTYLSKVNASDSATIINLQARLDTMCHTYEEFDSVQSDIESLTDPSNAQAEEQERVYYEDTYYELISAAKVIINKAAQPNSSHKTIIQNNLPTTTMAPMPAISIPEFNGSYETWVNFKQTFDSLVSQNPTLTNLQKFYYLKSALQGGAAQIISSITISEENYDNAWQLLTDRYENKKAIIHTHVKSIFELQEIHRENHQNLRKFTDTFLAHYRSLEKLGERVNEWSTLLIYLLGTKLPIQTRREWEICSRSENSPTIINFSKFLTERCCFLESLDFKLNISNNPTTTMYAPNKQQEYKRHTHVAGPVSCSLCKQHHFVYACQKFKQLLPGQRIAEARNLNLCINCLRPGHQTRFCKSLHSCSICRKRHHSILHLSNTLPPHLPDNYPQSREFANPNICKQPAIGAVNDSRNTSLLSSIQNTTPEAPSVKQTNGFLNYPGNATPLSTAITPFKDAPPVSFEEQQTPESVFPASYCALNQEAFTILPTAVINIYDAENKPIEARALLDSGSQCNFITRELFDRLNLPSNSVKLPISGLSQNTTTINQRAMLTIASTHSYYTSHSPFYIIKNITDFMPQRPIKVTIPKLTTDIPLADAQFGLPAKIDVLLGAAIFFEVLRPNQIKLGYQLPILQETEFGYIASGDFVTKATSSKNCLFAANNNLAMQLEKFWTIEDNYSTSQLYSKEESECEEEFIRSTRRDQTGRFIVKLPLKHDARKLGNSYHTALNRFLSQERRFTRNESLKQPYTDFMTQYEQLGHMTRHEPPVKDTVMPVAYFLPHHLILKMHSVTTAHRVVFDGSARTTSGYSLNDILKVGPTIQNDLFNILIRFRKHPIILIADIAKMYRQINVDPSQRNLQCILWRKHPSEPITQYVLNTLTYGTAPASYLATRCLKQISLDVQNSYPAESETILNDFYIDDLLTGSNLEQDIIELRKNLVNILQSYGLELRKFASNRPSVLKDLAQNELSIKNYIITDDQTTKVLGVSLNLVTDQFNYASNWPTFTPGKVTKRIILSTISKIFDPLGLVGPIIIQAKILLQKLWCNKLDWDASIPQELCEQWSRFYNQIHTINDLKIPRHIFLEFPTSIQLHCFSDASNYAYGACLYARSEDQYGNIAVHLIAAKSRVAPIKTITLPCLELCGALLSARLAKKTITALQIRIDRVFFYTDSTIVLSWLAAEPATWKTFVCNRISEIHSLSNVEQWHHIPSAHNPADLISRGISAAEISSAVLWWQGPNFLSAAQKNWPHDRHISHFTRAPQETPEYRTKKPVALTAQQNSNILSDAIKRYSSFSKLVNIIGFCLRFISNLRPSAQKQTGSLTSNERERSRNLLIKTAQRESFPEELQNLKHSKPVKFASKLISLNPFIDKDEIIRVGGRLKHASISHNRKHPIILPANHHLTQLIIEYEHIRNLHPGPQATLSHVRANYWPLKGKQSVRKFTRKCIKCFRANPKSINPLMGDLPEFRLNPSRPFTRCGVDYCGPFQLKDGKYRNRKIIKGYVCVFICMTTKAVHLELVTEMTSACFINALERLVSRRGCCKHIYSDNGTNFIGANNELTRISNLTNTEKFNAFSNTNSLQWHFIPAKSPHFGGLWEAAVGSLKRHLKRILSQTPFTFEEFYTILSKVEAVLNSRPLTPLSDDPHDLEALTPGHFIIGEPMTAIPEANFCDMPTSHLSRYMHIKRLHQHIWKRWQKDYLNNLQQRTKWRTNPDSGSLRGALVLLKEESTPPMVWPLGRIQDIHPGSDNIVRVVTVRTKNGVVKRAMTKVCVLPL